MLFFLFLNFKQTKWRGEMTATACIGEPIIYTFRQCGALLYLKVVIEFSRLFCFVTSKTF